MLENDKLLYNSRVFTSQAALTDGLVFVKTLHQIFFYFWRERWGPSGEGHSTLILFARAARGFAAGVTRVS